jgi:hypothetical protein
MQAADFATNVHHVANVGRGGRSRYEPDFELKTVMLSSSGDPQQIETLPDTHLLIFSYLLASHNQQLNITLVTKPIVGCGVAVNR